MVDGTAGTGCVWHGHFRSLSLSLSRSLSLSLSLLLASRHTNAFDAAFALPGLSALHMCANRGNSAVAGDLIKRGVPIDLANRNDNSTALHNATRSGSCGCRWLSLDVAGCRRAAPCFGAPSSWPCVVALYGVWAWQQE